MHLYVARAAHMIPDPTMRLNWLAFMYFQKGMPLLFGGQEHGAVRRPDLFNKDTVHWHAGMDDSDLLRRLAYIKKKYPLFADSAYKVTALPRDVLFATHEKGEEKLLGIFSVRGECSVVEVWLPDGTYENLITGDKVEVFSGRLSTDGTPIILRA